MDSLKDRIEDLGLTNNDIKNLTEAFKKDEFRNLLAEYVDEVTSPEHRAQYEKEVTQIERERGIDIKFVHPDPGYVIKSAINGSTKAFINVCKNVLVGKPTMNIQEDKDGKKKPLWNIPHLFANPREDLSKSGQRCNVYDFLVHPDTYRLLETNINFKKMIHSIIVDGLKKMLNIDVDENNFKFPKLKYKGITVASVIRNRLDEQIDPIDEDFAKQFPDPYGKETTNERSERIKQEIMEKQIKERNESELKQSKTIKFSEKLTSKSSNKNDKDGDDKSEFIYSTPKYTIKHQSIVDLQDFTNSATLQTNSKIRPNKLIIEILFPLLNSANQIDLNFYERRMLVVSEKPAKYKLDVALPYDVDDSSGSAKFDKITRKLIITLPVIPLVNESCSKSDFDDLVNDDGVDDSENVKDNNLKINPLIEVISETKTEIDLQVLDSDDDNLLPDSSLDTVNVVSKPTFFNSEVAQLPSFRTFQNEQYLSFTLDICNIKREYSDIQLKNNLLSMTFVSMGDGGYPINFKLCLQFQDDLLFETDAIVTSVSLDNVVVKLTKKKCSQCIWKSYKCGIDENCLEDAYFETVEELKNIFIQNEDIKINNETSMPVQIQTKQNGQNFNAEFKCQRGQRSILKQRTASESSDDSRPNSNSSSLDQINRQISTQTITSEEEDCLLSSSASSGFSSIKKSVSFSEHIDRAVYLTHQSVSSLHATLKNKRKKAIKKEQRQEQARAVREERRRRRSSGSFSMESSGGEDHASENKEGQNKLPPSPMKLRLFDKKIGDNSGLNIIDEIPSKEQAFSNKCNLIDENLEMELTMKSNPEILEEKAKESHHFRDKTNLEFQDMINNSLGEIKHKHSLDRDKQNIDGLAKHEGISILNDSKEVSTFTVTDATNSSHNDFENDQNKLHESHKDQVNGDNNLIKKSKNKAVKKKRQKGNKLKNSDDETSMKYIEKNLNLISDNNLKNNLIKANGNTYETSKCNIETLETKINISDTEDMSMNLHKNVEVFCDKQSEDINKNSEKCFKNELLSTDNILSSQDLKTSNECCEFKNNSAKSIYIEDKVILETFDNKEVRQNSNGSLNCEAKENSKIESNIYKNLKNEIESTSNCQDKVIFEKTNKSEEIISDNIDQSIEKLELNVMDNLKVTENLNGKINFDVKNKKLDENIIEPKCKDLLLKNETILSWEDGEHNLKPYKCTIQFTNTDIYELDMD